MKDIHLTVAVVVPRNNRYLMVRERDKDTGRLVYNQPAGHVEHGEDIRQAAVREALEETGWQVSLEGLIGIYNHVTERGVHFCRICFAALPRQFAGEAMLDAEIEEVCWMDYQSLRSRRGEMRSPMVLKAIEDYEKGTIAPLALFKSIA